MSWRNFVFILLQRLGEWLLRGVAIMKDCREDDFGWIGFDVGEKGV